MKSLRQILQRHTFPLIFLLLTWGIFFVVVFARIISLGPNGLTVYHEHAWSDWGLHTTMINIFAHRSPATWFAHHPIFAHGKFTYPFVTNLISGLLVRLGFSVPLAIQLPSILFALTSTMGLYAVSFLLTKSKQVSVLAVFFTFLSSGLGFIRFVQHRASGESFVQALLEHGFYTRLDDYQWYSGNIISGLMLPQRAFLMGFAVGLVTLSLFLYVYSRMKVQAKQRFTLLTAGVFAGMLPIVHMHTFIVLVVVTGMIVLTTRQRWRQSLWFVVPSGLLSTLLFFTFVSGGIENSTFFQLKLGWTATGGLLGWLFMWWRLWGVALPLSLIGLWLLRSQKLLLKTALGFLIVFVLANTILFQPIAWDNSKLFFWAYAFLSIPSAYLIIRLWKKNVALQLIAVLCCLLLTATGFLDLSYILHFNRHQFLLISKPTMEFAEQLRIQTSDTAIFATAPEINQPIMMWGARPILMSYWAYAMNLGFDHATRQKEIETVLQGGERAEETIDALDISYVLIGPGERRDYDANETYYASRYPTILQSTDYAIYDVR